VEVPYDEATEFYTQYIDTQVTAAAMSPMVQLTVPSQGPNPSEFNYLNSLTELVRPLVSEDDEDDDSSGSNENDDGNEDNNSNENDNGHNEGENQNKVKEVLGKMLWTGVKVGLQAVATAILN
jgi:hypothetical protein